MSYDIYSLHVDPGEANASALETILHRDNLAEGDALDPAKEARKRSIAARLTTAGLGYEVIEHDYAELAEQEGVTQDEARRHVRHLQVDNGELLVELDEECAVLKVPYSTSLEGASIAEDVFDTLRLLREEARFVPYDPQLGRELDIESDREAFAESFARHLDEARREGGEEAVEKRPRAPWWKRVLGRG